jgi:hypothetical protein
MLSEDTQCLEIIPVILFVSQEVIFQSFKSYIRKTIYNICTHI